MFGNNSFRTLNIITNFEKDFYSFRIRLKFTYSKEIQSYAISSADIYRKNNAILKAGKIKPTRGTKIEGKNAAVIIF